MGLHIRLNNINSQNDFIVSYKSGDTLNDVTTGFTLYDRFEGGTTGLTISGVTLNLNTKYWIKIQDEITNKYIIENIYTHDSCYYECYDVSPTPTPTITSTPTKTSVTIPTPSPTKTTTPTPTPTITPPSVVTTCISVTNLIVSSSQFNGEGQVVIQILLDNTIDITTSFDVEIITANYGSITRTVTINSGENYGTIVDSVGSYGEPIINSSCIIGISGSSLINCDGFNCFEMSCPCS